MDELYVYPDMEMYEEPPSWKSDDYYVVNERTTMGELLAQFSPEEAKDIITEYMG